MSKSKAFRDRLQRQAIYNQNLKSSVLKGLKLVETMLLRQY